MISFWKSPKQPTNNKMPTLYAQCLPLESLKPPKMVGDVGYNLPSQTSVVVPQGAWAQIKTGVRLAIPDGYYGLILPRSSANVSGRLVVLTGVIDTGFRGELTVMIFNMSKAPIWRRVLDRVMGRTPEGDIVIAAGQSLAQIVFYPSVVFPLEYTHLMFLPSSERGENGYGSTGGGVSRGSA